MTSATRQTSRVRSVLTVLATVFALSVVGATVAAPSALASGHCPGGTNICAFANAGWKGGGIVSNGYGNWVHSYTEVGSPIEGCTHTSFNDCASSIDNDGPYNGYYFMNAACTGERYNNAAGTGAEFIGSFWNDTFSSDRIGYSEGC